jgi:hypothetical protein
MAEREAPVDDMAPWTIKSVSTRVRTGISLAARREGVTVGRWVEKRYDDWEADGSPVQAPAASAPSGGLAEIADMLRAATEAAQAAGIPLPKPIARQSFAILDGVQRAALGKPPRTRRPPRLAAPSADEDVG